MRQAEVAGRSSEALHVRGTWQELVLSGTFVIQENMISPGRACKAFGKPPVDMAVYIWVLSCHAEPEAAPQCACFWRLSVQR